MEEQTIKFLNKTFTLAAILIVGVLVFFVGEMVFQNKSLDQQNTNQVTVSGEGKVYAKPDVAIVSLGVTTASATVADVAKNNTDQMNAVIAAVKQSGVVDKDIQTTNYNLSPVYNDNVILPTPVSAPGAVYNMPYIPATTGKTLKGYTLEQDVQVKIRDFTKIGDVLSKATTAGANLVGDLQFTIDNPEKFQDQARAQAIAQAKVDAQNLAKESGVNLGKIINVSENNYNPYPVSYNSAMKAAGVAESAPTPTIQPGQQEIDITIYLTYQVR